MGRWVGDWMCGVVDIQSTTVRMWAVRWGWLPGRVWGCLPWPGLGVLGWCGSGRGSGGCPCTHSGDTGEVSPQCESSGGGTGCASTRRSCHTGSMHGLVPGQTPSTSAGWVEPGTSWTDLPLYTTYYYASSPGVPLGSYTIHRQCGCLGLLGGVGLGGGRPQRCLRPCPPHCLYSGKWYRVRRSALWWLQ